MLYDIVRNDQCIQRGEEKLSLARKLVALADHEMYAAKRAYAGSTEPHIAQKNVRIIGDYKTGANIGIGLRTQNGNTDLVEDVHVEGFRCGIVSGSNCLIRGGDFKTDVGLLVEGGKQNIIDITGMKLHKLPAEVRERIAADD